MSAIENPAFEPMTTVYDCVARERPFSIVTQTAPGGLKIFIPEPFVPRNLVLNRVTAASGERYENEAVTAWTKGDEAMFLIDNVRVTDCDLNREEGLWQAAKLAGVDFRAVGTEQNWVLEIRQREKLRLRYDDSVIEATATNITSNQNTITTTIEASSASGDLRVTLYGEACTDATNTVVYETSVFIEYGGASHTGCGRALR
jgi:membrane-bound inhibitor of C-type lysozyme